jgi:hypothetical protein
VCDFHISGVVLAGDELGFLGGFSLLIERFQNLCLCSAALTNRKGFSASFVG